MRNLNKREKILIGSFFIVFIFYIVSNYWIKPIIRNIDQLQVQRTQLSAQWNEMKNWVGQETKLNEKVSTMEKEVNEEIQKVAPANQSSLYWEAFNQIARDTGSLLTRMDEGKDMPTVGKTRTFTIAVSGSESAVMEFIHRMQTMTYVTAVKTGTMNYTGGTVLYTFQLIVGSR